MNADAGEKRKNTVVSNKDDNDSSAKSRGMGCLALGDAPEQLTTKFCPDNQKKRGGAGPRSGPISLGGYFPKHAPRPQFNDTLKWALPGLLAKSPPAVSPQYGNAAVIQC